MAYLLLDLLYNHHVPRLPRARTHRSTFDSYPTRPYPAQPLNKLSATGCTFSPLRHDPPNGANLLKPHPARLFTTAHLFTQPLVVHPAQPQGPAPHLSSPLLSLLHTPGDCVDGGRRPHLSLGGGALSGESSGVHRSMLTMDRVRPRLEAP